MSDRHHSLGILHRYATWEEIDAILINMYKNKSIRNVIFSFGTSFEDFTTICYIGIYLKSLVSNRKLHVLIDIAHAHSNQVAEQLSRIRNNFPDAYIIAGNVATYEGAKYLVDAGADAIRVGIAGGSHCTTKDITGYHIPTLESVRRVSQGLRLMSKRIPIIADGGIRNSSDIAKAIALGADAVCIGGLLAGTDLTPGDIKYKITAKGIKRYKEMYGMSSEVIVKGRKGITPEGRVSLTPYRGKGSTDKVIQDLLGGLRSAYSYSGAKSTEEFKEKVRWEKL